MPKLKSVDITRSFSRKLNMAAHGGEQYETIDLSCTMTAHEVDAEDMKVVSKGLYNACKSEVEASVKEIDSASEEDEAPKKKSKKASKKVVEEDEDEEEDEEEEEAPKKKKSAKRQIDEDEEDDDNEEEEEDEDEEEDDPHDKVIKVDKFKMKKGEFEDLSPYMNDITLSKTLSELSKAAKRIKSDEGIFTKVQKEYLTSLFLKKKAELEEDDEDEE